MNQVTGQTQPSGASAQGIAPGWYPDPMGNGNLRWWDGLAWSQEHVRPAADAGQAPTAHEIQGGLPRRSSNSTLLGWVGFIWGGLILVNHFLISHPTGNAAYNSGVTAGAIFGAALFGAGARVLYRRYLSGKG